MAPLSAPKSFIIVSKQQDRKKLKLKLLFNASSHRALKTPGKVITILKFYYKRGMPIILFSDDNRKLVSPKEGVSVSVMSMSVFAFFC